MFAGALKIRLILVGIFGAGVEALRFAQYATFVTFVGAALTIHIIEINIIRKTICLCVYGVHIRILICIVIFRIAGAAAGKLILIIICEQVAIKS